VAGARGGARGRLPDRVDSAGVDAELQAIVTKSFGRMSLHLNASYERATGARGRERENLYEVVLGVGYPIGAPMDTRLLLLGDVFARQSALRGDDNAAGVEAGLRYRSRSAGCSMPASARNSQARPSARPCTSGRDSRWGSSQARRRLLIVGRKGCQGL
jgi:hypothetical protein